MIRVTTSGLVDADKVVLRLRVELSTVVCCVLRALCGLQEI